MALLLLYALRSALYEVAVGFSIIAPYIAIGKHHALDTHWPTGRKKTYMSKWGEASTIPWHCRSLSRESISLRSNKSFFIIVNTVLLQAQTWWSIPRQWEVFDGGLGLIFPRSAEVCQVEIIVPLLLVDLRQRTWSVLSTDDSTAQGWQWHWKWAQGTQWGDSWRHLSETLFLRSKICSRRTLQWWFPTPSQQRCKSKKRSIKYEPSLQGETMYKLSLLLRVSFVL